MMPYQRIPAVLGLAFVLFSTAAWGQASSDNCSYAAANQYPVGTSCTLVAFNKPNAYVPNYNPGTCNSGNFDDAFGWFQATATSTTITYDPAGADDAILHILTGPCGGPYAQIGCVDAGLGGGNETITVPTTIGTNYLIRVQRYNTSGAMNGSLCVFSLPPPANDNPCTATPLTVGASCTFSNSTNAGATPTAGVPAPGCANYLGGDVWFTAVVPANGRLIIDSNTGVVTDGGMALYTAASCAGPFTLVECDDDDSNNGAMSVIDRTGLTPGSTVYIRMWEFGNDNNGSFQICAHTPPPACGTTVYDPGGAAGNYANGTTFTATYCPTTPGDVVTITFTAFATEAGFDIVTIYDGPNIASPIIGTYSGTTNPGAITATNAGGCLTLRFTSDFSNVAAGWAANITCATPPPPVPACGSTVYDTGGAGGNYGNNQSYTVTYCPVNPAHVVTINFTAFNTELNFDVVTLYDGSTIAAPVLASFSGTNNPGSFSGTVPGACITLQFISDGSFNFAGWAANITCAPPPPPPAGDCIYVLTLADAAGDGWGSSFVNVDIVGPPTASNTNYSLTTGLRQILIGVYLGQFVTLTYNNSGPNQTQNSYSLSLQGSGSLFNSGSPPVAGISYLAQVDCVPPPAPPQDCAGADAICNAQTFNNNSNNTGNVVDLNVGNQGCLASGERQGTWYYFSPSASGTIGFTINPTAPTDYDFAVWGPMTAITCPPVGPPVRCSFAAPQGDTGLGNGAVDLSEGAGGDRWVSPLNVLAGQVYILYIDNFSTNGQSFNLSWQLSNGASLDCSLLPISEILLKAERSGQDVHLVWTTLFERGSDHFQVEHSVDGILFDPLGPVGAAGHSESPLDYAFDHKAAPVGMNYYRIRGLGTAGEEQLSATQGVLVDKGMRVIIAPNPASELAEVILSQALEGPHLVRVVDAGGRLVRAASGSLADGQVRLPLSLAGMDRGSYLLEVVDPQGNAVARCPFVRQ